MSLGFDPAKVELIITRELPWLNRGIVYTITDLWTGLSYNIVGEHNSARHTDYVCATRTDTEIKLRTSSSGNFNDRVNENWTARPCILTIGDRHFAAATHNAAHGGDAENMVTLRGRGFAPNIIGHIKHFCVWVLEAQTGGSATYHRNMLNAVKEAYRIADALNQLEENVPPEFPISEANLQAMIDLGVIQSPEYWRTVKNLQYLDALLTNAVKSGRLNKHVNLDIRDFNEALYVLRDAGIMNSPGHWYNQVKDGNVQHLDRLLINLANRVRKLSK